MVGKAQYALQEAVTTEQFEATAYDISFNGDSYQFPGNFYLFLYSYDGQLKAHANLHQFFGETLGTILEELGRSEDGVALHQQFVDATEGRSSNWVQYPWTLSADETAILKIAYIAKVVILGENYYLGSGFNFVMESVVDAPRNEPCSDAYDLLCAFDTSLHLSSHALAHVVSSPNPLPQVFNDLTFSNEFRRDEFYVFMYDFNSTCVVHGGLPGYIGMTLDNILERSGIGLDAEGLHQRFREAAEQGGGFILYQWAKPGDEDSKFFKLSYIFKVSLEGRDYYGGVGFNKKRYPVENHLPLASGTKKNGQPVECSNKYDSECSEVNVQAIVGHAKADLSLSLPELGSAASSPFNSVLAAINDGLAISPYKSQ